MPYTPPGSQSVLVLPPTSTSSLFAPHHVPSIEPTSRSIPPASSSTSALPASAQRSPISLKLKLGQHANVITTSTSQTGESAQQNSDNPSTIVFSLRQLEGRFQDREALSQSPVPSAPNPIRKKSGELVKPSLKSSSSFRTSSSSAPSSPGTTTSSLDSSNSLSALSSIIGSNPPFQTPSKMVHFDAQLEHIKVFKSEQKPAAVSRDGSPELTTDTEGEEESGVEYFGYKMPMIAGQRARANAISVSGPNTSRFRGGARSNADNEEENQIAKRVFTTFLNFSCPSSLPTAGPVTDSFGFFPRIGFHSPPKNVSLASLELRYHCSSSNSTSSPTSRSNTKQPSLCLEGTIVVRNVAFDKRVAIRFTLDEWQTVSEVIGRWVRSVDILPSGSPSIGHSYGNNMGLGFENIEGGRDVKHAKPVSADLFAFSVRLSDHLSRIASKTLKFCIRFVVAGGEFWDNNHGSNYIVKFGVKEPTTSTQATPSVRPSFLGYPARNNLEVDGLPPSSLPEDLIKRLDRLTSPDAEKEKERSTVPFPAHEIEKDNKGENETNVSAWLKNQSKFVASKDESPLKALQRRSGKRRAFTFPPGSVPGTVSAAAAKSANSSNSSSGSSSILKEDIFASFGPYSGGDEGSSNSSAGFGSKRRNHQRSSSFDGWTRQVSELERLNLKIPDRIDSIFCHRLTGDPENEELVRNSLPPISAIASSASRGNDNSDSETELERPLSSASIETVTESRLKASRDLDSGNSLQEGDVDKLEIESALITPSLDSNPTSSTTVSSPSDEMNTDEELFIAAAKISAIDIGNDKNVDSNLAGFLSGTSSLLNGSDELSREERRKQYSAFVHQFCFFTGLSKGGESSQSFLVNDGGYLGSGSSNSLTSNTSHTTKFGNTLYSPSLKTTPGSLSPSRWTNSDSNKMGNFFSSGTVTPPLTHWSAIPSNMGEIIT